jgi:hypothetical protein
VTIDLREMVERSRLFFGLLDLASKRKSEVAVKLEVSPGKP